MVTKKFKPKYKVEPRLFDEEVDELVADYVARFNTFGKKSAEGVIGMGKTALEARRALKDTNNFRKFCNGIPFENGSSAVRKLIDIGRKADLLEKHLDRLPSSWTTLYTLSTLSEEQLERGLSEKLIHATMTGDRMRDAVDLLRGLPPRLKGKRNKPITVPEVQPLITQRDYGLIVRFDTPPDPSVASEIEAAVAAIAESRATHVRCQRTNALAYLLKYHE